MDPLLTYLRIVGLRLQAKLQDFAAQEPVRLRAALTSLVLLAAVYVPSLGTPAVVTAVATGGAVVLPLLVGESTRKRVTPTP
jgi:Flp pilus assembly protein TadB